MTPAAVVIRSPWDYHHRVAEFDAWLDRLDSEGGPEEIVRSASRGSRPSLRPPSEMVEQAPRSGRR